MTVPYAEEAERAVAGAMLIRPEAVTAVCAILRAEDFSRQLTRGVFEACCALWKVGIRPEPVVVAERLKLMGVPFENPDLISLQLAGPAWDPTGAALVVAEYATRRRGMAVADEMRTQFENPAIPVLDTLDKAKADLDVVTVPSIATVDDVVSADEYADRADDPLSWVIPGLLDQQDRTIIVAGEGSGKSVLSRWLAVSASQGVHPFTIEPMPPCNTLVVDLENPARIVRKTIRPMLSTLRSYQGELYDPDRCHIWHRPGGIDLRSRAGAAELDAVCAKVRPRLVCLGPLYKSYRGDPRRSDHDNASDVAAVFDDLRTRHGFALVLEHHAPLKQGGFRELRPFGSLLWSQWPEVGLTLAPMDDNLKVMEVGFYRGSRDERCWPSTLTRGDGTSWPWTAYYPNGWRAA